MFHLRNRRSCYALTTSFPTIKRIGQPSGHARRATSLKHPVTGSVAGRRFSLHWATSSTPRAGREKWGVRRATRDGSIAKQTYAGWTTTTCSNVCRAESKESFGQQRAVRGSRHSGGVVERGGCSWKTKRDSGRPNVVTVRETETRRME